MYRCEAKSVEGFVQQLAVSYVSKGYHFYVRGFVKGTKDPRDVDRTIITNYGLDISKYTRSRRKAKGQANIQYLRHERDFVILATSGVCDRFFIKEGRAIRNINRTPIRFRGYSVSYRGGKAHVRIDDEHYRELKSYFLDIAMHRRGEAIEAQFRQIRFEPYAPVRYQLLRIWYAVNQVRKKAGYEKISRDSLREKRYSVKALVEIPSYLELEQVA